MNKNDFIFENKIYPCFAIKIFKERDELQIHRDHKVLKKYKISSFPIALDSDGVMKLLKIIKEDGCLGLIREYPELKETDQD